MIIQNGGLKTVPVGQFYNENNRSEWLVSVQSPITDHSA